jgi:hypothetical protein
MLNEALRNEIKKTRTAEEIWYLLGRNSNFNIKTTNV